METSGDPDRDRYARDLLWGGLRRLDDEAGSRAVYANALAKLEAHHPAFLHLIDERFFDQLEAAGGIRLDRAAREDIVSSLALLAEPSKGAGLVITNHATHQAKQLIESLPAHEVNLRQLLADYVSRADEADQAFSRSRIRARVTWIVEDVARSLVRTFVRGGGSPSFPHKDQRTFQGPLPNYLSVAWTVMPPDRRRNSPQAYVAMAAKAWRVKFEGFLSPAGLAALEEVHQLSNALPLPSWVHAMVTDVRSGGKNS